MEKIPLLVIDKFVLFPGNIAKWSTQSPLAHKLIDDCVDSFDISANKKIVGVLVQKDDANIYSIGVLAEISAVDRDESSGFYSITLAASEKRFKIKALFEHEKGYKAADIVILKDKPLETEDEKNKMLALLRVIQRHWEELLNNSQFAEDSGHQANFRIFSNLIIRFSDLSKIEPFLYFLAFHLRCSIGQRQDILESVDIIDRLTKILTALPKTLLIEKGIKNIENKYEEEQEKLKKEDFIGYLQEQIKGEASGEKINNAVGDADDQDALLKKYKEIKDKISKEAQKIIEDELSHIGNRDFHSADAANLRTHLDYCLNKLPWGKETQDCQDFQRVKQILDEDHYGLEKIKERILEHLAVRKLNSCGKAPIFCFVGPPGVGKTSLGQSIARALGRNFARISVGGVRDEAEIRGHRRTYVASIPGRIIGGIVKADSENPIFMIDEIDKMVLEHGDPQAALLEVFDPEQNFSFEDHYLGFGFDLRKVFFIATANGIDEKFPPALKDRLEIIYLSGYTELEKINIAKQFLISKQVKETGINTVNNNSIIFTQAALERIINEYTDEAGVRNLERCIHEICRKIAYKIVNNKDYPRRIEPQIARELLGPPKFIIEKTRKTSPGVSIGLGVSENGGTILYIEALIAKGSGQFSKTGGIGKDMKDSEKIAQTLIRSAYEEINFDKKLVHIHAPRGYDKDGPSAGLAIYMALESFCRKQAIRENLAMSGEINLEKLVWEVGGIREKVLAAERAGIKEVILPKENENDLEELPEEIKLKLKFHFVETIDQAMEIAFSPA